MKTIATFIAAAALFATASAANADFSSDFFKKQQLYGENITVSTGDGGNDVFGQIDGVSVE